MAMWSFLTYILILHGLFMFYIWCTFFATTCMSDIFLLTSLCVNGGLAFTVCAHFPFPCYSGLLLFSRFVDCGPSGFMCPRHGRRSRVAQFYGLFAALLCSLILFLVSLSSRPLRTVGLVWFVLCLSGFLSRCSGAVLYCDCFPLLRVFWLDMWKWAGFAWFRWVHFF